MLRDRKYLITSWWRYNPLVQKPVSLNPIVPWSWFHYYGPDPAAGVSYGEYFDETVGESMICEKLEACYSPITGQEMEFIGDIPLERVTKIYHKSTGESKSKTTCKHCAYSGMHDASATPVYCVKCGSQLEESDMKLKERIQSKVKADNEMVSLDQILDVVNEGESTGDDPLLEEVSDQELKQEGLVSDEDVAKDLIVGDDPTGTIDEKPAEVQVEVAVEEPCEPCPSEEPEVPAEEPCEEDELVSLGQIAQAYKECEAEETPDMKVDLKEILEDNKIVKSEEDLEVSVEEDDEMIPLEDIEEAMDMDEPAEDADPAEPVELEPTEEMIPLEDIEEALEEVKEEGKDQISIDELLEIVNEEEMEEAPEVPMEEGVEAPEEVLEEGVEAPAPEGEGDEFLPLDIVLSEKKEEPIEFGEEKIDSKDLDLEDTEKGPEEVGKKDFEKAAEGVKLEPVTSMSKLASASAEDIDMVLFATDTENPFWNVTVAGVPAARIQLQNQSNADDIRKVFCSEDYARELVAHCEKSGFVKTMQQVKAEFWATEDTNEERKARMRAEVSASFADERKKFLNQYKSDFMNCLGMAVAGINKNLFPEIGNPLKDHLFTNMKTAGLPQVTATSVIEKSFTEASAGYFDTIFEKATEYMGLTKEARQEISKTVASANTITPNMSDELDSGTLEDRVVKASTVPQMFQVKDTQVSVDSNDYKSRLKGAWRK